MVEYQLNYMKYRDGSLKIPGQRGDKSGRSIMRKKNLVELRAWGNKLGTKQHDD